jgi:hypothetical protein
VGLPIPSPLSPQTSYLMLRTNAPASALAGVCSRGPPQIRCDSDAAVATLTVSEAYIPPASSDPLLRTSRTTYQRGLARHTLAQQESVPLYLLVIAIALRGLSVCTPCYKPGHEVVARKPHSIPASAPCAKSFFRRNTRDQNIARDATRGS